MKLSQNLKNNSIMMKTIAAVRGHAGTWSCVAAFGLLTAVMPLASCDHRDIHEVVKEMAVLPADTVGMKGKALCTNPFSLVDIDCFADVTYHQTAASADHRVVLRAPEKVLENIAVQVEEGKLRIAVDRRYKMPEKAVAVIDVYAPFVNRFLLDGGKCLRLGKIALTSPLELMVNGNVGAMVADSVVAPEVMLELNGSGSIDLKKMETGSLRALLNGGGIVVLSGHCRRADLHLQQAGKMDIRQLVSDTVPQVLIEGKGKVLRMTKK